MSRLPLIRLKKNCMSIKIISWLPDMIILTQKLYVIAKDRY